MGHSQTLSGYSGAYEYHARDDQSRPNVIRSRNSARKMGTCNQPLVVRFGARQSSPKPSACIGIQPRRDVIKVGLVLHSYRSRLVEKLYLWREEGNAA